MFDVDWNNPQTLWLNLTNATLGLVTLAALVLLVLSMGSKRFGRNRQDAGVPLSPGLRASVGPTMADGGQPIDSVEARRGGPIS